MTNKRKQIHSLSQLASLATSALLYEVALSPKPGLVDRLTNGAHKDMTFFTFIDSVLALSPFFEVYLSSGYKEKEGLNTLFTHLREEGKKAELAMMEATDGINTHKGANFSLAVLLGSCGYYLQEKKSLAFSEVDSAAICALAGEMTRSLIEQDFASLSHKKNLSYGEKLYLTYGITGIRGEAGQGYPSLTELLLPYLRENLLCELPLGHEQNQVVLLRALLLLMSQVEDGNIIHRGGIEGWQTIKKESGEIHEQLLSDQDLLKKLSTYDQLLIQRHLSPGGAADLLSLGIFFILLENSYLQLEN